MKVRIAIASAALIAPALLGAVGCSSSDDEADPQTDAGAPLPDADAGAAPDTGVVADAGADAPPPFDPTLEPVTCASEPCVVEIAASSGQHICARRSDGSVGCWGEGADGQLGADPTAPTPDGGAPFGTRPVVVSDLPPAAAIALGGTGYTNNGTGPGTWGLNGNTCALVKDGSVHCWGKAGPAFEGVTRTDRWVPARMAFPPATHVALGNGIVCVLDAAGVPVCSGAPDNRDVLVPSSANTRGPRSIATGGGPCVKLAGSARNVFCVEESGVVYAWGFGRSLFPGEVQGDVEPSLIGRLSSLESAPPAPIPGLANVTSISAPWSTACVVSNGVVFCWGRSDRGQLGTGGLVYQMEPQPIGVVFHDPVKQVSAGYSVTCAVTASGGVYCWGDNERGQLAEPPSVLRSPDALKVKDLPPMVQVAVMEQTVCALAKTGEVWCWGANDKGQLARGTRDNDAHPDPRAVTWAP
ncbi:MAG: hypothetical protein KF782_28955 [Labilithrix sp.]|nr:hypothetical protein [Labilithrix sp.]